MKNYYHLCQLLFGLVIVSNHALGQTAGQVIRITYPESRAIFQRGPDNTSVIYLSGSFYQPVDSVQARVVAEVTGQGINTNWVTIQRNPMGGIFQGSLRAQGGWYRLEVQAFVAGAVIGSDVMRKIGIGEVFIITGQSNAQGFQNFGAPGATDDRVNCVTYDNSKANSLADPPAPTFQQLGANSLIGPRGQSAWCWGVLGDLIVKQYQVPVLFINTAWQGTVIKNWRESADGIITKNIFALGTPDENFPAGMPYANLIIALRYYCSLQGLRAVLWQQGENDNVPLHSTRKAYGDDMQYLVNKTRADTQRYPAWVLARSSYNSGQVSQDIIQAQNDVINTYNNNVFAGPFTDNIQIPRYEGNVHFGQDGLKQLGQAWFESMNAIFFASSRPLPPLPPPTLTVACAPDNGSLRVGLPGAYKSYAWNTGQATQSLTITQPGLYRAILKDTYSNTYLSPLLDVQGGVQPVVPTVSLANQPGRVASSQQQICADSVLTLVANTSPGNSPVWSTGIANKTISLSQSGTYSVQSVNVYGCKSTRAQTITLVVRPKLPVPTVEQVGTYSLQAVLTTPAEGPIDQFDWRRAGELIPQNGPIIKVVTSGNYAARSKATFSLGGSSLTCASDYSATKAFAFDPSTGGLSVFPNPSSDGQVKIETVENLKNAIISVYSLAGQILFRSEVPLLDQQKVLDLSGLSQGEYLVRVQAAGFNVSRRVIIVR